MIRAADLDVPRSDPITLPETIQATITEALADLPAELIWVDAESSVESAVETDPDTGLVANGDGIIIALGNVHFQEDDSVLVPARPYCGNVRGIVQLSHPAAPNTSLAVSHLSIAPQHITNS